jgi:hypothetical protein
LQKQQLPFRSFYQVCYERQETHDGRIIYKIGQGHIFHQFGKLFNYQAGISFLEKSISNGYKHAIQLLCLCKLKQKFGFHKTYQQIF